MKTAFAGLTLSLALIFAISCKSVPSNPPSQSGVTDAKAKPPSTTFKANVETDMKFGEVLITGGWQTGLGKSAYLIARPELVSPTSNQHEGKPAQILIEMNFIEMDDDMSVEDGFSKLRTDSNETESFLLATVEDFDKLMDQRTGEGDARIMATPMTTTLSGRPAKLHFSSLSVTFTPEVAGDNESLKLAVQAEWIRNR